MAAGIDFVTKRDKPIDFGCGDQISDLARKIQECIAKKFAERTITHIQSNGDHDIFRVCDSRDISEKECGALFYDPIPPNFKNEEGITILIRAERSKEGDLLVVVEKSCFDLGPSEMGSIRMKRDRSDSDDESDSKRTKGSP